MIIPVAVMVDALARHLPRSLVGADVRGRLVAAAHLMPDVFSHVCFECRLSPSDARVDLSAAATVAQGARAAWRLGRMKSSPLAPVLDAWTRSRSALFRDVESLAVELDLVPEHPPRALVFARVNRAIGTRRLCAVARALASAVGAKVAPGAVRCLAQVQRQLAGEASPLHIGALPHRDRSLRCVVSVRLGTAEHALRACSWPGNLKAVQRLVDELGAPAEPVLLDLDLGPGLAPRCGISFSHPSARAPSPRFRALATRLGHRHRTSPVAALRWIGDETLLLPRSQGRVHLARSLGLKVSLDENGATTLKVYFAASASPVFL